MDPHNSAMKSCLNQFQQGPADTPHQKDRPPKVMARHDSSHRAAPSHIHRRLGPKRKHGWKRCMNSKDDGNLENVTRPESDWLAGCPDLNTLRIRGSGGNDAGLKAAVRATWASITAQPHHRLTISRPRCTDTVIQTGVSTEWHSCRPGLSTLTPKSAEREKN